MEEKKPIKISLTGVLLIISLIVIVLMGMVIYNLVQNKKITNESMNVLNDKISKLENELILKNDSDDLEKNEDEKEVLDENDELVKQLYNYVLKSDNSLHAYAWQSGLEPVSFYRDEKTTYEILTDAEKTLIVMDNYTDDELKVVNKSTVKDIIDTLEIHDDVNVYEDLNKKSLEIFNKENDKWIDIEGCAGNLYYKNGNYYEVSFEGGGKGTGIFTYSKIQKVEKDENHIYIYDKFVYVDSDPLLLGNGDGKIHIYTTADCTKQIGAEEELDIDYYSKYEDKLETFKHTFEKTEDGNYYWISTEIVK